MAKIILRSDVLRQEKCELCGKPAFKRIKLQHRAEVFEYHLCKKCLKETEATHASG